MGNALIVEFIGVPGAGKTTFMPFVKDHFKEQQYQAYSVVEAARPFAARTLPGKIVSKSVQGKLGGVLLWQIFYKYSFVYRSSFYRHNPVLRKTVLDFQKKRPISNLDREHVLHWFHHQAGSYQFLKTYGQEGEILLFDEGFIHRVVQLFASENEMPDFASLTTYLDLVPKPEIIIFPKASSEVCEKRVYERGLWERFQIKTPEEISLYILNAHQIVNFTVEYIKEKGWTVIEVENDTQSLPVSASDLRLRLSKMMFQIPKKAYLN